MFLEEPGKVGRFLERQLKGNFLNGPRRLEQERLGFGNGLFRNPGVHRLAGFALDDRTKIVRMQALKVGKILNLQELIGCPGDQTAEMGLQILLEVHDNSGGMISLRLRIIMIPEHLFDPEQKDH